MGTQDQSAQGTTSTITVNKKLNETGANNVVQVPLRTPGANRCMTFVPAAPASIIGNCVYYYRPYSDQDTAKKTGVNFKTIADYAVKLVKNPQELREIFEKLITNETNLIPANSDDPNWSRWHNFMARHNGCSHVPPSYYISYGYYYCSNFGKHLLPRMNSQEGKKWLNEGRKLLQTYMEKGLQQNNSQTTLTTPSKRYPNKKVNSVTVGVQQVELDNDKFKTFAYNSHVAAYLDAGIADVPIADLVRVFGQPNVEEWVDIETWKQAVDVAWEVVPHKFKQPVQTWEEAKDALGQAADYVIEQNQGTIDAIKAGGRYIQRKASDLWEWIPDAPWK